jgi:hypothetical protein
VTYQNTEVKLYTDHYATNGNIAILMIAEDGDIFTIISKNVQPLADSCFAVDENNNPGIAKWLIGNNISEDTGGAVHSGYVKYPVHKLLVDLPSVRRDSDER